MYTESQFIDMLRKEGVRPSLHRLAVLGIIANDRIHPSADELYVRISEKYPGVSRTTVYNALHTLVDAHLVMQLDIENGVAHYDFRPQPEHSHFMCSCCGEIFDMELPSGLDTHAAPGFRIDSVALSFKGLCPRCIKNN